MTRGTYTAGRRGRGGFTLIELMVVVAIIAILAALTTGGITRVRNAALRAQAAAEISQLSSAIGAFKVQYKVDFIPTSFKVKKSYMKTDPEYPYLLQMFSSIVPPTIPPANTSPNTSRQIFDTGWAGSDLTLTNNSALVFFLGGINQQGFSTNKAQPFLAVGTVGEQRTGPFFDFPANRLTTATPPEYLDPWRTPYAYFTAVRGNDYTTSGSSLIAASYTGTPTAPGAPAATTVAPFSRGSGTQTRFEQQKSFQIISAGPNMQFGPGGTWLPGTGSYDPKAAGGDDLANFVAGQLGFAQ